MQEVCRIRLEVEVKFRPAEGVERMCGRMLVREEWRARHDSANGYVVFHRRPVVDCKSQSQLGNLAHTAFAVLLLASGNSLFQLKNVDISLDLSLGNQTKIQSRMQGFSSTVWGCAIDLSFKLFIQLRHK